MAKSVMKVGQRILAPTVAGGLVGGAYGAYERYENNDFYADPTQYAKYGAIGGFGLGLLGNASHISDLATGSYKGFAQYTKKIQERAVNLAEARMSGLSKQDENLL